MRAMMGTAQAGLLRALYAVAEQVVPDVRAHPAYLVVERQETHNWASITFNGHRHMVALRLGGPRATQQILVQAMEAQIGQLEYRVAGHYLVDAMVSGLRQEEEAGEAVTRLDIEAVTLLED